MENKDSANPGPSHLHRRTAAVPPSGAEPRPPTCTAPHTEEPDERLQRLGVRLLSDAELVATLLGSRRSGTSRHQLAVQLLEVLGGLDGLARSTPRVLQGQPGISPSRARALMAAFELGRRALSRPMPLGAPIGSSRDVFAALAGQLGNLEREVFRVLALDSRHRLVADLSIAEGSLSRCHVETAEVFRAVLAQPAGALILVHNHPSGEPEPSPDDVLFTRRMVAGAELLGLHVLDHIIIGRTRHFSFLDAGLMPAEARAQPPRADPACA